MATILFDSAGRKKRSGAILRRSLAGQHRHDYTTRSPIRRPRTDLSGPPDQGAACGPRPAGGQADPRRPPPVGAGHTNADGSPQLSVIFVKPDGDDILFSTIQGRRKTANMSRDPRVTLSLHRLPASAVSAYATIHGTVELSDDPDGAFLQVIYAFRMGGATPPPEPGARRLIVRVRPRRVYAPFPFSSE
jgi:PPOX class probable F420-dependent enzyme